MRMGRMGGRASGRWSSANSGRRATSLRLEHLEQRAMLSGDEAFLPNIISLPPRVTTNNTSSLLTGPQAGTPHDIGIGFLTSRASQLGLTAADIASARVTSEYRDAASGITHIYLQQTYQGLDVINGNLNINIGPKGEVINFGGGFVPGMGSITAQALTPAVSASQAIAAAARSLNLEAPSGLELRSSSTDLFQTTTFSGGNLSRSEITAKLQFVTAADGGARLAWMFAFDRVNELHYYQFGVDAANEAVLFRGDLVKRASYNVFPRPLDSPDDGPRSILVDPADPISSPLGWHDNDGVAGAEFTDTRGNRVFAQTDEDGDNGATTVGVRPNGGANLTFDFPLSFLTSPAANREAAVTNAFYLVNTFQDIVYKYGFTEAAGNFQDNNFGRGGVGNDHINVDVQDDMDLGASDNAFFQTAPDGSESRMGMFIWTAANPARDAAFAADVLTHEGGHGVNERLIGGPVNNFDLFTLQSAAMDEGTGDFFSLMFILKPGETQMQAYPAANWVSNLPVTGPGLRTFPYSFDMTINPETLIDFNANPESHGAGEIWCSALWDVNWLLINQYGFEPSLGQGYSGPNSAGNLLMMQLLLDGQKLMPGSPSYLEGRDAILLADQNLTGGANQAYIWTGFARRGMGSDADDGPDSDSFIIREGFDQPISAVDDVAFDSSTTVVIDILANDSDAQGLNPATVRIVSGPSEGTVTITSGGQLIYTPDLGATGSDTIIYTVDDNTGDTSNEAVVTINHTPGGGANNRPPVAVPDERSVGEDAAQVRIGILSNDYDPDGDFLNPASVQFTSQPALGTITYNSASGVLQYTANPNMVGVDSFTYRVADNKGSYSNDAAITVTIEGFNDPPIPKNDLARTDVNLPVNVDALLNDIDVDGILVRSTLGVAVAPQHGSVFVEANGTMTYTPSANYSGGDSFMYSVQDSAGARAMGTVEVRVGSPVTVGGAVYADINNNGIRDANEIGIPNVNVTLVRNEAPFSTMNVVTDLDGNYLFTDSGGYLLPGGSYSIVETHPGFFADGKETAGTPVPAIVGDDAFNQITIPAGGAATKFNFGERGLRVEFINAYLDRRAFYASSMNTLAGINLNLGDVWFAFDNGIAGELAANSSYDGSQGSAAITLYDQNMRQLASSNSNPSGAQIGYAGSASGKYFLKLSGTNPQVDFDATVTSLPAADPVWKNSVNPLDANNDSFVTPNDVLVVVNLLNSLGAGDLKSRHVPTTLLVDTNGDGSVSPLDALLVINHLNGLPPAAAAPIPRAAGSAPGAGSEATAMNGAIDEAIASLGHEVVPMAVDLDAFEATLPFGRKLGGRGVRR